MHYDFTINAEIKRSLIENKITYQQIAEELQYSVPTIKYWLSRTLDSEHRSLIQQAVQQIRLKKECEYDQK